MKKIFFASVLALTSTSVFADFDYAGTNSSTWDIGGEILPRCVAETYDGGARSKSLNLALAEAQTTASVTLWCNTPGSTISTKYTSDNLGVMKDKNGNEIAYQFKISGTPNVIEWGSDGTATVEQIRGYGNADNGGPQTRSFAVIPQVTGNEFAGEYKDTITVMIAAN